MSIKRLDKLTKISLGLAREPKFHNSKCSFNGLSFDSKKELLRYRELLLLEKAFKIANLQRQVKFVLVPAQYTTAQVKSKSGKITTRKVLLEKELSYVADFVYFDVDSDQVVVEDVKSAATKTQVYRIKKKLMLFFHGIAIKEVL